MNPPSLTLRAVAAAVLACCAFVLLGAGSAGAATVHVSAHDAGAPLSGARTFRAPAAVTNVAVHWIGAPAARVRVALSRDGHRFGRARPVELDELGATAPHRGTYGTLMAARGVRAVRVFADR